MSNIFYKPSSHNSFTWDKLGNIKEGRADLGEDVPVLAYRLLEYSLNHVLAAEYGAERCAEIFRLAGHLAGVEFAKNVLTPKSSMDKFVRELQQALKDLKMGILRIETADEDFGHITVTVAQDLDCSGLPPTDEVVCNFDEGFLSGILDICTSREYEVREIDCWASGDRVCRFECKCLK